MIAAGSTAGVTHPPDEFSDHDFWLMVRDGTEGYFRTAYDWLPETDRIVLTFPETEHGVKVVYDDGHLIEFAAFVKGDLGIIRGNDLRVMLDKDDITAYISTIPQQTQDDISANAPTDIYLMGQFLTNLLVGIGRYRRGEKLSGHKLVKMSAIHHLLQLLIRHAAPPDDRIDNLDTFRRIEQVIPEIGAELNALLLLDMPQAALAQLALVDRLFAEKIAGYPAQAVEVVRHFVAEAVV